MISFLRHAVQENVSAGRRSWGDCLRVGAKAQLCEGRAFIKDYADIPARRYVSPEHRTADTLLSACQPEKQRSTER